MYQTGRSTTDQISILQAIENDAALLFDTIPGYSYCIDLPCRTYDEHLEVLQKGVALVALDPTNCIAGFALILPVDNRPHLLELAVAREHQGKGVGNILLDSVKQWIITNKHSAITLTTFREIPWNMPWYQRSGFVEFAPGTDSPELLAICQHERESEVGLKPRVAMIKRLDQSI
ncbi:MAG: GNAT family N-acetyltransferase [Candidatus Obscuribacter sp.]|nr:GNAT family N-acetyltransferase [Candidatus Obscuribacter sp.]